MSIKSLLSFFALATVTTFSVVACTASADDPAAADPTGEVQDEELKKSLTSCSVDADCVAVPRGGCCSNGFLEAVNKDEVHAYADATKCTANPRPACPLFVIHDTRVAQCDTATRQCKMIAPEDIHCGGFVFNLHSCPEGYECSLAGMHPDQPGKCVKQ
jgi:hypothetical protein